MNYLQLRLLLILPLFFMCLPNAAHARDETPPARLKAKIPALDDCKQIILVTVEDWSAVSAHLQCFERTQAKATWKKVFPSSEVVIGKNGLAWGIGLHGTHPAESAPKREGDGRAPAGVFFLHEAFGYAAAAAAGITTFPYKHLTQNTEGIDDSQSRYYNRVVDIQTVKEIDWKTSEKMLREDGLYRWGVVVEHNWKPFPSFGSCIFLHIWLGPNRGTAGCTAMPAERVESIVRWLDRKSRPILVQLPTVEYVRLREQWMLP